MSDCPVISIVPLLADDFIMEMCMITSGKVSKPFHALLYGPPKVGKTHLALQAEKPIVIDADDGSGQFDCYRIESVSSQEMLVQALREVFKSEDFKTVIIDSVTAIDRILIDHLLRTHNWKNMAALDYGKCYEHLYEEWKKIFSIVEQVKSKGKNIIWIGHQKIAPVKDPLLETYDKMGLEVSKNIVKDMESRTDAIFYYRWKVNVTKDKDTRKVRGLSNGTRQLFTKENAAFIAGNRYGLEPVIENPTNETLWSLMK